ncbi:MAG: glycoside hydrolase family 36 protein [Tepidiformaceae bacterium]
MTQLPWDLVLTPDPVAGLDIRVEFDPGTGRLEAAVTNVSGATIHPGAIRLAAELDVPAAEGWAWLQGRYMQADAFVRAFGSPMPGGYEGASVHQLEEGGRRYISREQVALVLPAQASPVLLAGCLRMDRFFFDIEVELDEDEETVTSIAFVFDLRGAILEPGEAVALPPVLLVTGRDPVILMEAYAAEAGRVMGARMPAHVPTGWCSWYYFYGAVSEADVIANLEEMARSAHPAEYIQIDDGYQSQTGDWLTANAKFPSGMGALASRIGAAGYRPGLWLAPLLLNEASETLGAHPEIALRTHEGDLLFVDTWLGRCAVLDCTNPAAAAWLGDVIRTVVHEWGYEYLKLDALAFAAVAPTGARYHEPGTTAPANLRRGLEIIREAAGGETFVLGCTCHFGPALGLVDAMRVGPDVKENWEDGPNPSVRHAMRMVLQRNWMHGRWWANDPDCLIVRDTNSALEEAEVRFLATAIVLSGGMVVASDNLPLLSPARRAMALALFPPPGVAARPVDPSEGPVPSAWRARLGGGRALVGILNWQDTPRWVVVSEFLEPGEVAFDAWNGRVAGAGDILLRPHEGALWQVAAPGPGPRVVGDTGHIAYQGLFQRPVSGRIQVRNDAALPRTIAIEARGRVFPIELAPGEMRWFD